MLRYQRRARAVDGALLRAYLAGANSRRIDGWQELDQLPAPLAQQAA